jgi:hypothetical protein
LHASSGQGDLPRVVAHVGPPANERDHPAAVNLVNDKNDRRPPGAPPKLAPAVHRMEQVFESRNKISQRRLLVNWLEAGKLGKVADAR